MHISISISMCIYIYNNNDDDNQSDDHNNQSDDNNNNSSIEINCLIQFC